MNNLNLALWVGCVGTMMLTACTTTQELDLPATRQSNMQQDMELWQRSQQPAPEQGLTLQAAIEMGLENNLALRAAAFERAMLDDDERAAKLEMLPDLTVSAQRFRRDNQPRQDFIRDSDGQITQSNVRSAFRTGTQSQLEITWSVLDFGLSYVRSRQAGYESLAQQTRTVRQAQLLALDITDAFWRSALAEDALDYLRSAESELNARKVDMQNAAADGFADPLNVAMTSSRLVDVEIAIRDLQAAVSTARVNLARLLGLPMHQQFRLIREPIRPILSNLPRLPQLNNEAMLRYALLNRPELYESDLNELIREDDVQAAILSIFPDLTFGFGQFYDDNRLLRNNDWTRASASISWNLLNIPATLASKRSRENAVEMTRFQRLQTTAGVVAQVHLALLDYAAKTDRFLLRDESARLADKVQALRRANLAVGQSNVLQVSESQLAAVNAKLLRDQSVVELLVAYSRLQSSLGVPTQFLRHQMTALCLPADQLEGSCLAAPGEYTPLVQLNGRVSSGNDDLSVVKIETISQHQTQTSGNSNIAIATSIINQPAKTPAKLDADVEAVVTAEVSINKKVDSPTPTLLSTPIYVDTPETSDNNWVVFIGTFSNPSAKRLNIQRAQQVDSSAFGENNVFTQPLDNNLYRVGFSQPSEKIARESCEILRNNEVECWVASTQSSIQVTDSEY